MNDKNSLRNDVGNRDKQRPKCLRLVRGHDLAINGFVQKAMDFCICFSHNFTVYTDESCYCTINTSTHLPINSLLHMFMPQAPPCSTSASQLIYFRVRDSGSSGGGNKFDLFFHAV